MPRAVCKNDLQIANLYNIIIILTTTISGSLATTIGKQNPFRYKGYYYDDESGMYYCLSRYYVPAWCRWLNGCDATALEASNINGLNMFSYCFNNPLIYIQNRYIEDIVPINRKSIGNYTAVAKHGLNLPAVVSSGISIYGIYTAAESIYSVGVYFSNVHNLKIFATDMALYGTSMTKGVLAFAQITLSIGRADIIMMGIDILLDVIDSIDRQLSIGGILLGATLTLAKNIGIFYLSKGIIYAATSIGSAIGGPLGTVIGLILGVVISVAIELIVDYLISNLIDKITK